MDENEEKVEKVEVIDEVEKNEPEVITDENPTEEKKGFSIASLVLGLGGLLLFAIPCGILAIIFSILGRKKGGKGMATAGLVLGIIDVVFGVIYFIIQMAAL